MYPTGKLKIFSNDNDLVTGAGVKLLLVKSTYTYVATHEFVDNVVASDIIDEECDATGYVGAFGGADRLVPASRTATVAASIVEYKFTSPTWTAIGNGTNNLVGGVVLLDETGQTLDTATPVFCFDDLVGNVNTNSGDLTYDPNDASGGKMLDW